MSSIPAVMTIRVQFSEALRWRLRIAVFLIRLAGMVMRWRVDVRREPDWDAVKRVQEEAGLWEYAGWDEESNEEKT